jgi:hypothetical protein
MEELDGPSLRQTPSRSPAPRSNYQSDGRHDPWRLEVGWKRFREASSNGIERAILINSVVFSEQSVGNGEGPDHAG